MRMTMLSSSGIALIMLLLATCGAGSQENEDRTGAVPSEEFNAFWHQGKAEVARYSLKQARYGEMREGHAVLIQVTEDFLVNEHVKHEGEGDAPRTSVLKTNLIERYSTGIYDYSHMTSVFSPVDGSPALKVNNSVQDWCGQVFAQLNRRNSAYAGRSFSYFQTEGDREFQVEDAWLEDALFNQVRIDPKKLPTGKVRVLPSLRYLRLMHKPAAPVEATAELKSEGAVSTYTLSMPSLSRTLSIRFASVFPHAIEGWAETRPDGWGASARTLTTEAVRTHHVMEPYWQQNSHADDPMRERLGLARAPLH
ncbi:MAG: septum formation inhibitor Maf [Flavobacteriales bacterium]|nr:septum formation inhibitor Maf [Flavobacteriales bacterium]